MVDTSQKLFTKFIIKQAILATAFTYLIAGQVQKLASIFVDTIIEPLFSIDLDNDGNPDLKQLEKYVVKLFNIKFSLGKLIAQFVKFCFFLIFIFIILTFFMKHTDLINLKK